MFENSFTEDQIDAALLNAAIENVVTGSSKYYQTKGWHNVYGQSEGSTLDLPMGKTYVRKNTYEYSDYDTMPQGGSDFMIVLQVTGDDRFFVKRGHIDSYGGVEWDAGMKLIEGQLKTVVVFD